MSHSILWAIQQWTIQFGEPFSLVQLILTQSTRYVKWYQEVESTDTVPLVLKSDWR